MGEKKLAAAIMKCDHPKPVKMVYGYKCETCGAEAVWVIKEKE